MVLLFRIWDQNFLVDNFIPSVSPPLHETGRRRGERGNDVALLGAPVNQRFDVIYVKMRETFDCSGPDHAEIKQGFFPVLQDL